MLPQSEHVIQHILDQVARGNVQRFYSNDLVTPGSEADDLLMSRISPDRQSFDLDKSQILQTPQTPDGDMELSLDMDGLALQPSLDELSGAMDPKLLGEFKANVCRSRPQKLQIPGARDHLQSTPIAGNLKPLTIYGHGAQVKSFLLCIFIFNKTTNVSCRSNS